MLGIVTESERLGTRFVDQFEATFQSLEVLPVHKMSGEVTVTITVVRLDVQLLASSEISTKYMVVVLSIGVV